MRKVKILGGPLRLAGFRSVGEAAIIELFTLGWSS